MANQWFDETTPMDYDALCSAVKKLDDGFRFLQVFTLTKSVLGRRIPCMILGSGTHPVLFVGTHHAMEYLTTMELMKFTVDLCEHYERGEPFEGVNLNKLFADKCLYIVPMLNPDGVELHLHGSGSAPAVRDELDAVTGGNYDNWNANAHGVDLNHNYNAGFDILHEMEQQEGFKGPGPTRYGGTHPESEPETHALCNLCRRMLFSSVYAFHSQGEEIYWHYGPNTPECAFDMAKKLAAACSYTASQPEGLASHGGFKDWYVDVFGRPGFTVEIGKGKNPLPPSDLLPIYEKLKFMMLLALQI